MIPLSHYLFNLQKELNLYCTYVPLLPKNTVALSDKSFLNSNVTFKVSVYYSNFFVRQARPQLMLHSSYDILYKANLTVTFSFRVHATFMPRWWIRHLQYSQLYYAWKSFGMPAGMHEWCWSTPTLIFLKTLNFLWSLHRVVNQFTATAWSLSLQIAVMCLVFELNTMKLCSLF